MIRIELFLLLIVVLSALGVVTSQHQSRKLFAELDGERAQERALAVEWDRLQLEQSTWAALSRIEEKARVLGMVEPVAEDILVLENQEP